MNRLSTFLVGFLLGGATVFVSLHYHVVRASDGFHLIPKVTSTFDDTLVDIRQFGFAEWQDHAALAVALQRADKQHLLVGAASQSLHNAVDGVLNLVDPRSSNQSSRSP